MASKMKELENNQKIEKIKNKAQPEAHNNFTLQDAKTQIEN